MTKLVDLDAVLAVIHSCKTLNSDERYLVAQLHNAIRALPAQPAQASAGHGGDVNGAWHDCECKDCIARRNAQPAQAGSEADLYEEVVDACTFYSAFDAQAIGRRVVERFKSAPAISVDPVAVVEGLRDKALIDASNPAYGRVLSGQAQRLAHAAVTVLAALRSKMQEGK